MRRLFLCLLAAFAASAGPARAWSDHTLATYWALRAMPEVAQAPPVAVESIDDFLIAEEAPLAKLLADDEAWAIAHVDTYPPRPAALAFVADPQRDAAARRLAFLHALRVAANIPLALYLQPDSGAEGEQTLPVSAVSTLPPSPQAPAHFIALAAGDMVAPLSVIATAADEPDNGVDINCWDDSPAAWGKTYGFGDLPFGNPALSFSTQAPFHMGFYHESRVLTAVAPFLTHTYPPLRAHQFASLAAFAFRTGHDYWGWRFSGMALHYIQDATQPYHTRALPNESTIKVLAAHVLTMAGHPDWEHAMTVLVANRHLAFERYAMELLQAGTRGEERDARFTQALGRSDLDHTYPAWSDRTVQDVITAESSAVAEPLTTLITTVMPTLYVNTPAYDFGVSGGAVDLVAETAHADTAKRTALDDLVTDLFGHLGAHSRNALRMILHNAGRG